MNTDLSDMEVSENNSLAQHYATTRISNLRDSLQDTAANSDIKNNPLRKSVTTNSQDLKGSTVGGQTNLSTQLTERLLDDYDQKLANINKKDKK